MRKGLGLGLFGAFLAAVVAPQLANADAPIPADGLSEGSGHWVTGRYELDCKAENRLFVDATVHTRIVDGAGKDDCKGERLEISNRATKPFYYGINGSIIATVASGGVVTIFVPRPSNPEADTRVPLTGRHFSDCGVGKMWKNGTCKDWEDPCPAGESRADITDLWQAQGEDYSLSAIQWRIMNECFDEKGKFDSDDAECKTEVKRCEDQRNQISGNQHDHSTVQDLALSDMRKQYLGQTYVVRDQKIFEEPDAAISCAYTTRETMKKRSNDRHAIGERHWRVANEYSNWLIWKNQVNRECSLKNNQAPKQIATFTPRKYQEPTYGPASGRKHGTTNPTPDSTRSNGQSLDKSDDKDKDDCDRRRHTFEHHNDGPPLKAQPLEQNLNKNGPGQNPSPSTTSRPEPARTQPPTTTNTPPQRDREGGHEQHQNTPRLPGQPLDQNLGKTGPQSSPLTPNGRRAVPLGVQASPTNPTNPSTSTPSRTNPPTIADLGKKMEEERREREQAQRQSQNQNQLRERADADRQRNEREQAQRQSQNQNQLRERADADRQRNEREQAQRQSQNQNQLRERADADRQRNERERADRERNERASREADQRRDEQRKQMEQQRRQADDDRRRQQMEESRRQQQEESRRQQQEEARRQRDEERRRQAQEESRRQQEESRRQSQQRMQPSTSFGRRR